MVKTTPPGSGSLLLRLDEANPLFAYFERHLQGVRLLATGPFTQEDLGMKCYHSKTGAVELVLNHLLDDSGEYVVVDMTAGADSFASGLFTKFDLTFLVVEPTFKAVSVYRQYTTYARDYAVNLRVIGNKVEDAEDVAFLREQVGDNLLAWMGRSDYVRLLEKSHQLPLIRLEPENAQALAALQGAVDACEKDWKKFSSQMWDFHRQNALSWANALAGEDLTAQIDPHFCFDPRVVEGQP
jgi:CO dehydrogenase maturation factor